MSARRALPLCGWIPVLAPDVAAACATCIDSAWGNRGFGWPFVALMLAPFVVAAALAGVLVWSLRRPGREPRPDASP